MNIIKHGNHDKFMVIDELVAQLLGRILCFSNDTRFESTNNTFKNIIKTEPPTSCSMWRVHNRTPAYPGRFYDIAYALIIPAFNNGNKENPDEASISSVC
jgi:maltoporin